MSFSDSWLSMGPAAMVIPVVLAAVLFVLLGFIWFLWTRARRRRAAIVASQMALGADELNLDLRLGPLQKVSVSVNGRQLNVAYRQQGLGRDVLLLHGIGASMLIYRRIAPLLQKDYRVTTMDFPGFGASDKPRDFDYQLDSQAAALNQTIEALNLDAPLLVASSMGGAIALRALTLPSASSLLTRGLVAVAPAVDPTRVPTVLMPLASHGHTLHKLGFNTRFTVGAVVRQVIARRELITPPLVEAYAAPFQDDGSSASAFMKAIRLLGDRRMPEIFKSICARVLVVRGLGDRLVKQASCEKLHSLISGSEIVTHPTAGHHVMEDEPMWLAETIRTFDSKSVPK